MCKKMRRKKGDPGEMTCNVLILKGVQVYRQNEKESLEGIETTMESAGRSI